MGDETPPTTTRGLRPLSAAHGQLPAESWADAPKLSWTTLVSADRQPSDELVAGVCTINTGDDELRLFYCFAATSFSDIEYEFPDGRRWRASS